MLPADQMALLGPLLDNMSDGVVVTSAKGMIQLANPAAERIYRLSAADLCQLSLESLCAPEDVLSLRDIDRKHRTIRHRWTTGEEILIEVSSFPLPLNGTICQLHIVSDVTESAATRADSIETAERLRALVNTAADGIVTIDDRGIIESFNQAAEKIFGYRAAEVIGHSINLLMPYPHNSQHDGYMQRYMQTGQAKIIGIGREVPALRKDGVSIPVHLSVGEFQLRGKRFFTGIIHDISKRKQSEAERDRLIGEMEEKNAELRRFTDHLDLLVKERTAELISAQEGLIAAKNEAERASAAKSRFLAAASHDLRQPLQAANLLAYILAQHASGADVETVNRLQHSLNSLGRLLNSLLDISKLEAGLVTAEARPVRLQTILDHLQDISPLAERKGIKFRIRQTELVAMTDPALMEQIARNLIQNAVRYTEDGSVLIACRQRGDSIAFSVRDTGIGIPPAQREAIFEEFYQVDNPARNSEKGLGLGLAIVKKLAALLGHPVLLTSRVGRGSVFEVVVPRANQESAENRLSVPSDHATGSMIVIDDDALILATLTEILTSWGLHVVTGSDAEQAIERAKAAQPFHPELVLADYRLKVPYNGIEAIRRLQKKFGKRLEGIILTGDIGPARLQEVHASGFDLIHKPIQPKELRARLTAAFKKARA